MIQQHSLHSIYDVWFPFEFDKLRKTMEIVRALPFSHTIIYMNPSVFGITDSAYAFFDQVNDFPCDKNNFFITKAIMIATRQLTIQYNNHNNINNSK